MAMGGWGLDACHGVVLDRDFCTAKYGKHVLRCNPVTGLEHHVDRHGVIRFALKNPAI